MPKAPSPKPVTEPGFFASIPASIYSPSFYAGIPQRSFWKAFWYLVGVTFLILLIGTIILFGVFISKKDQLEEKFKEIVNVYPEDLVITVQDGQVYTNVQEPYFFTLEDLVPESWTGEFADEFKQGMMEAEGPSNLVVIDTITPYSQEQFYSYETAVWLTKDAVYVMGDYGEVEATPLTEVPDTVVDYDFINEKMGLVWDGFLGILPVLVAVFFVLILIGLVIGRMIYLLLLSVATLILASIMKVSLDYGNAYKVSIYGITLSTVLSMLGAALSIYTGLGTLPFLFTIVALIIIGVNLQKAKAMNLMK